MAAAIMYVTVAGAGDKSGDTWAKAMGYAEWETDFEGASEAGDIYYVTEGTYTLTSNLDANLRDGTSTAPICVIGVKSGTTNEPPVYSDWATGDARPLIAGGANYMYTGDYWKVFNLRLTATGTYGLLLNQISVGYNLKLTGSATNAFYLFTLVSLISIEGSSSAGKGIEITGATVRVFFSYIHDCSAEGIDCNSHGAITMGHCIIDSCVGDGIIMVASNNSSLINNTIYNCANGISGTTALNNTFINNIINDCTVGANWGTQEDCNIWINNNLEGNGTKAINVAQVLPHSDWLETTVNPAFTDDVGGDFSLASGSDCINAGLAMILGVGA